MNSATPDAAPMDKNAEGPARREAAHSLVGNQASTATKYGEDDRHSCSTNF